MALSGLLAVAMQCIALWANPDGRKNFRRIDLVIMGLINCNKEDLKLKFMTFSGHSF
jgi:hypothetical protein